MDTIKSFFDDFTFHARVMPAIIAATSLLLYGVYKSLISTNLFESGLYIFVILAFLTLFSYISRNLGKKYEEKMVEKLGALPTTIIMRYADRRIDKITKTRYHQKLANQLPDITIPESIEEENEDSDEVYSSAMNWLRNYANSNKDKYPLVYKELKDYNFWRNLYGIKYYTIVVYALIAIREFFIIDDFDLESLFFYPYPNYVAFILMIVSIIVLFLSASKTVVEKKAFDYARTLAEVCESI